MFEKVNPSHPDKVADRIAGAMVDLAYQREKNPQVAVEVLIGHRHANIIAESSVPFNEEDVWPIIVRICGENVIENLNLVCVPQDNHLAENQKGKMRCGDNGIFRGVFHNSEENLLKRFAQRMYRKFPTDGKFVIHGEILTVCQSCIDTDNFRKEICDLAYNISKSNAIINPLGDWTGGLDVDSGATNRKLGSDMGRAVTGGGLHGKDLSKADVSVNIVCYVLAEQLERDVVASCSIGDEEVCFCLGGENDDCIWLSYEVIVMMAKDYIDRIGGFEKLAEWGLIR